MWWVQATAGTRDTLATPAEARLGPTGTLAAGDRSRTQPYSWKSSSGTSGAGSGPASGATSEAGLRLRRGRMGVAEDGGGSSAGSTAVVGADWGAGGGPGADEA